MSDRAVCYIERAGGGDMILRVRYADPRGAREWLAPGGLRQGPAVRDNILAAAAWVHEQVSGASARLELDVVLDLDGGVCGWLTAPGADEKTVRATVTATKAGVSATGEEREGAAASWLEQGELGTDVSIQALAEAPRNGQKGAVTTPTRQRLAVLSVPDLAVRIFLDELDRLGTEVDRVMSLWHALAAWEPGRRGEVFSNKDDNVVVASSEPLTAVLVIDGAGLAAWSWVQDGRLIAGGSLKIKRSVVAPPAEDEPGEDLPAGGTALRRIGARKEETVTLEVTRSDVGRVVSEWLAWSTQLGVAPARLVCLGPWGVTPIGLGDGLPDVSGVATVGAALGRAWPGTNVSAKVDEDAVGSTLQRLVRGPEGLVAGSTAEPSTRTDLVELSRRPGRAHRVLYRWLTLSLVGGAVVFVALGWRLGGSVGAIEKQADEVVAQRVEAIKKVQGMIKIDPEDRDAVTTLQMRLKTLQDERNKLKPDENLLAELNRLLQVFDGLPDTQLQALTCTAVKEQLSTGSVVFTKVSPENDTTALFRERLASTVGSSPRWINWSVRVRSATPDRVECGLIGNWGDAPKGGPRTPPPVKPPAPSASATTGEKPAETRPAEGKPAETKPGEPAAPPAASPAPADKDKGDSKPLAKGGQP